MLGTTGVKLHEREHYCYSNQHDRLILRRSQVSIQITGINIYIKNNNNNMCCQATENKISCISNTSHQQSISKCHICIKPALAHHQQSNFHIDIKCKVQNYLQYFHQQGYFHFQTQINLQNKPAFNVWKLFIIYIIFIPDKYNYTYKLFHSQSDWINT